MTKEANTDTQVQDADTKTDTQTTDEAADQADTSTASEADGEADAQADKGASGDGDDAKPQGKAGDKGKTKTIAGGADAEQEQAEQEAQEADEHKEYWPENWREKMAEHYAAGDKKAFKKELARLKRFVDPTAVYGIGRELENWRNEGGFTKIPGEKASDEDKAAFAKARGVPDKLEDFTKAIELDKGIEIGEMDKPVIDYFAEAAHKSGVTPKEFSGILNAYYAKQENDAAALDTQDETFRIESEKALKEEWGPAFKRRSNAIGTIFATAPGGVDIKNEDGLFARLMGGRMADGTVIGNDADMLRWLDGIRGEINPAATVVEDGKQAGVSIDAEIKQIEDKMRTDRRAYFKDTAMQTRYRELLDARDKMKARG